MTMTMTMTSPFDLRAALLEKHAQHVVLIHFPIAMFLGAVGFDLGARWLRKPALAIVAHYNLLVAAISTAPVVATGIVAWRWQLEGERLKGVLLLHLVMGVASSAMIWLVWWLHRRASGRGLARFIVAVELVAAMMIALTAHLGGFLSGINGAG